MGRRRLLQSDGEHPRRRDDAGARVCDERRNEPVRLLAIRPHRRRSGQQFDLRVRQRQQRAGGERGRRVSVQRGPRTVRRFRTNTPPCPPGSAEATCGLSDSANGGTADGAGAFRHNGTFSMYEMSHPLNSGDVGHDFALAAGDAIGFYLDLRMIGAGGQYLAGLWRHGLSRLPALRSHPGCGHQHTDADWEQRRSSARRFDNRSDAGDDDVRPCHSGRRHECDVERFRTGRPGGIANRQSTNLLRTENHGDLQRIGRGLRELRRSHVHRSARRSSTSRTVNGLTSPAQSIW